MANEIKKLQEVYKHGLTVKSVLKPGDVVAKENDSSQRGPYVVMAIDANADEGDLRNVVLGYFDSDGDFDTRWAAPHELTIIAPFVE